MASSWISLGRLGISVVVWTVNCMASLMCFIWMVRYAARMKYAGCDYVNEFTINILGSPMLGWIYSPRGQPLFLECYARLRIMLGINTWMYPSCIDLVMSWLHWVVVSRLHHVDMLRIFCAQEGHRVPELQYVLWKGGLECAGCWYVLFSMCKYFPMSAKLFKQRDIVLFNGFVSMHVLVFIPCWY